MPGRNSAYQRKLYFPTEDRILLHLLDYVGLEGEINQPDEITQFGIADAIRLGRSTVSKAIRRLMHEKLVRGHRAHVPSGTLRRTVYVLTDAGTARGNHRRLEVEEDVVAFRDGEGTERRLKVAQIPKLLPEYATLLEVAAHVSQGVFDARSFEAHQKRFVDLTERLPRLRYFFGRTEELGAMDAWLDSPTTRVLVITGIAGIGKTTLLSRKVEDWREKRHVCFHRIMEWTTLRNVVQQLGEFLIRLSRKQLAQYLEAHDRPELANGPVGREIDIEQIASILATDLRDVPGVLVYDDCQDAAPPIRSFFHELRTVLETLEAGPKLVVAGRHVPPFYDRREVRVKGVVQELSLGGLDPKSSERLLQARNLDLPPEALNDLYRQTAGHPLFLELVDAATAVDAADVHKYLEEELFSRITDVEAKVLTVASVFRYPVHVDALFIDESVDPATIRGLTEQSLLQEVSARVYDVHDVVRAFFLSMTTPRDRHRYHRWAAQFYVSRMNADPLEALHHFTEAEEVTSAARVAVKEGRVILAAGRSEELLRLLERLLPAVEDPAQSAELRLLKAQALAVRGEVDAAARLFEEIVTLPTDAALQPKVAEARRGLGDLLRRQSRFDEAQTHLEAALHLYRDLGDREGQAETFLSLGGLAETMSDAARAERYYERSLEIASALEKKPLEVKLHLAFGRILDIRGDHAGALARKERALALAETIADWHLQAWVLVSLGAGLQILGRTPESMQAYERGIETARRIGDLRMFAYGLYNAAGVCAKLDDLLRAEAYLKESEGIFRKLKEPVMEALALHLYGHVWEKRGKWSLAKQNLIAALELLRRSNALTDLARYATIAAQLYYRNGEKEEAIAILREASSVAKRLRSAKLVEDAEKYLREYTEEKKASRPTPDSRDWLPTT